ncbi:MAG: 2-hydroxyglutaryl-CoA dehydratase [Deltaproteobacteria bacterium]|nr:2-hydroxyglutaryl-CoA dehydratase [Deltaproteobacteria bacterium]
MITAGVDIGSLSVETVIYEDGKGMIAYALGLVGGSSRDASSRSLEEALGLARLGRADIARVVSTGSGREILDLADENITEITCIARGVHFLFPQCRTIIDIGGQDTKVIRIDEAGRVVSFDMNDKCAAGTGRFLEVMAHALDVGLEEMGERSLRFRNAIEISSVCTVFAESEVISLVSEGRAVDDILHALHHAVADRTLSLLDRVGVEGTVAMTGGVAKNIGVVRALEEKMGLSLKIYSEPRIVGALGAALLAAERKSR